MYKSLYLLFIAEVMRLFWLNNFAFMKLLQLFSYCRLDFFTKYFEYLFNTVLDQYGLIFYNVGSWSGINKVGDSIYDIDIGLRDTVEVMRAKNQVVTYHGALIDSSVIVVDGGRIP